MKPVYNGYEEKFVTGDELINMFPDEYISEKRHHATVRGISVADFLKLHTRIREDGKYRIFVNDNFCKVMPHDRDSELVFFAHTTLDDVKLYHTPDEIHIDYICPDCGGSMEVKNSRYGYFLGCHNYPKCKHKQNPLTLGYVKDPAVIFWEKSKES